MLGPDFESPDARLPDHWTEDGNVVFEGQLEKENIEWWKLFDDPVLDKLVQTAYSQNLSLRTAGLRILEARAQLGLVKEGQYLPPGSGDEWRYNDHWYYRTGRRSIL